MIRLMWRFGLLILAAIVFAWLADRPGTVTIRWLGREIEAPVIAAAAILVVSVVAALFLWSVLRRLWNSPTTAREYWRFRRTRKAHESLARGIIAAGAGDAQAASRHAAIAAASVGDEPLAKLLAAQAAQLKGDRAAVTRIFEDMAKSKETEALGLRGLFTEARAAGDIEKARQLAERALGLNPQLAWAATAVLQIQTARKDWSGAALTFGRQARDDESGKKLAALLAADALAAEDKTPDAAMAAALRAHKLDPALVPAALVAARLHIARGKTRKALAVLSATWKLSPHPDLAEVAAHAKAGEGPEARFERVRDFVGPTEESLEAAFALARAAVAARRHDAARKVLEPHIAAAPQSRLCSLMADIEESQGHAGAAREWLARALKAPRDPVWVSDGVASLRWSPVSPVTGDIMPSQWKPPFDVSESLGPPEPAVVAENLPAPAAEKPRQVEPLRPPDDPGPKGFDLEMDGLSGKA
jgi:HemY protein